MNNQLSQDKKDQFRNAMANDNFLPKEEILKLVSEGYEIEVARDLVVAEIKAYKKEVFEKVVNEDKQNEMQKVMFVVIFLIVFIGPVARVESTMWYVIAALLTGVAGYFGWKDKPVAGILGAMVVAIVFPYAYNFYFADRESFIRIEIIIPMFFAALPAIVVYKILSMLIYPYQDND